MMCHPICHTHAAAQAPDQFFNKLRKQLKENYGLCMPILRTLRTIQVGCSCAHACASCVTVWVGVCLLSACQPVCAATGLYSHAQTPHILQLIRQHRLLDNCSAIEDKLQELLVAVDVPDARGIGAMWFMPSGMECLVPRARAVVRKMGGRLLPCMNVEKEQLGAIFLPPEEGEEGEA